MATFSKKAYSEIAEIFHDERGKYNSAGIASAVLYDTAEALSKLFARDNPRFDRERFLSACGL